MGLLVSIAARNLRQSGRRTFFLALALVLVSMFLTLMLALTQGVLHTIRESATTLNSGHVNVAGFYKITSGRGIPLVQGKDAVLKAIEGRIPGLDFIITRRRGFAKVIGPEGSLTSGIVGVNIANEPQLRGLLGLAKESEYRAGGKDAVLGSIDNLAKPLSAVVFAAQARRLGIAVGDEITISAETNRGVSNTVDVTVVAVARDIGVMSDWTCFTNADALQKVYSLADDTTGAIMIYLKDPSTSTEVMNSLRSTLQEAGYLLMDHVAAPFFMKFDTVNGEDWVGQKLDLTIWEDEVQFFMYIIWMLNWITWYLTAVLMVIIAIGIANAMFISVRERTGEIGTLRAIGMSRGRVLFMIMCEAIMMGVAATTLGALIGGGLAAIIDSLELQVPIVAFRTILLSDTIHMVVDLPAVLKSIAAFTTVTVVAALFPAVAAARLQPITAIHKTN